MPATNSIKEQRMVEETINTFPAYPLYPVNDDIYNKKNKEGYLGDDNIAESKTHTVASQTQNAKYFEQNETEEDFDVPGSELDDEQEKIGGEDEENNYYNIGGDNHNNLDEDHPE
ncbi:MAG: hypothetical protein LH619_07345 [Chitinophagaceae bacterium]|nr:hypothetical protein [Chitinophagaceae bacterium]